MQGKVGPTRELNNAITKINIKIIPFSTSGLATLAMLHSTFIGYFAAEAIRFAKQVAALLNSVKMFALRIIVQYDRRIIVIRTIFEQRFVCTHRTENEHLETELACIHVVVPVINNPRSPHSCVVIRLIGGRLNFVHEQSGFLLQLSTLTKLIVQVVEKGLPLDFHCCID